MSPIFGRQIKTLMFYYLQPFHWLRHNLANFKQRLTALEKPVAERGIILSESQVQAFERKKEDDIACG